MSDKNHRDGFSLYQNGDQATVAWFERQWQTWPTRADERFTTNLSFHYGGVSAYRVKHGHDPEMSGDLRENIAYLDRVDRS